MSLNRRIDDLCERAKWTQESTGVLGHVMELGRHYNCNECYIPFGLLGGNTVSRAATNLVDLESDLRGQTRIYSQCPERKYAPSCDPKCSGTEGLPCGDTACRTDKLRHLPECHMIHYKPRPTNVGYKLEFPGCQPPAAGPVPIPFNYRPSRRDQVVAFQGQQGVKQLPPY